MQAAQSKPINAWEAFDGLPIKPKLVRRQVDPLATAEEIANIRKQWKRERTAAHYKRNRARIIAKNALYKLLNREKTNASQRRTHAKHRAKILEKKRIYWEKNRARLLAADSKYYYSHRNERILSFRIARLKKKLEAAA